MGNSLPKAVTSVVVKRFGGASFRVGFAEMNGWRASMEDAHVVFMQATWGFFGVFDGHGGSQCSKYVARRFTEELAKCNSPPQDGQALKRLSLKIDREFLDTGESSGSTGTFAVVTVPKEAGGRFSLQLGNVGDSRILLGRRDGTMVEGRGTDGGLTTDHKPNVKEERARIERTGGEVQEVMGVARVNGDLAVSRAFGDGQYKDPFKEKGGPREEERPVTADPELVSLDCGPNDFLVLVCDGISEGNFPNREVVSYAAAELERKGWMDPGLAAAAVCQRALERDSKDNLSCMIVLLGGGEVEGAPRELLPGPVDALHNSAFRTAYTEMAEHAGLSLAEAVELRYGLLRQMAEKDEDGGEQWREELDLFGSGPPEALCPPGSPARTEWFEHWVEQHIQSNGHEQPGGREAIQGFLAKMRDGPAPASGNDPGGGPGGRRPPPPVAAPPPPPPPGARTPER